ncbi:MAG TPA: hypothetical protein VFQ61_33765 [Polyangiaceae bacterium]|nr:hypothetical protein [Polyangiaceae bacterium]
MPLSPSLPLVAYAEALCNSAHVLFVGDARSGVPEALVERGARWVHVCDPDSARQSEAAARSQHKAVTFGRLDEGPLSLRDGFFDLVLLEDLSRAPDPAAVLTPLARLLAPRGVALIGAPNRSVTEPWLLTSSEGEASSVDYYRLYELVSSTWPAVRMLGEVPFVGYAIVDFSAEDEPSPVLDTSLLGGSAEEPEYFIALAGRERRALDEYMVVQVRAAELRTAEVPSTEPRSTELRSTDRASVTPPAAVPAVSPELARSPAQSAGGKSAAPQLTPRPPVAQPAAALSSADLERLARVSELERRVAQQESWIQQVEAQAAAADERADAAETELDSLKERLGNLTQNHGQERTALVRERDALKRDVERLSRRANDQEDLLVAKQAELTTKQEELKAKQAELNAKQAAFDAKQAELTSKQSELTTKQAAQQAEQGETANLRSKLSALEAELQQLRAQYADSQRTVNALQQTATQSQAQRTQAEQNAVARQAELERAREELEQVRGELEQTRAEQQRAAGELADLRDAVARQETQLREALTAQEQEIQAELARLERQLAERGENVRRLERELRETERVGRELVRKMTQPEGPERARAMAARLAEAEAELVTLRWSLEQLKPSATAS